MIARERVAVVVVNYNGGDLIRRCLVALAAQNRRPDRLIVVDNGSIDGSLDGLESVCPGVEIVRAGSNLGFAAANNRAAALVDDCDWLALINPDAYAEPGFLAHMLAAAQAHPEYSFFGARILMDDDPSRLDGVGDVYHVSGLHWREGHGTLASGRYLDAREIFAPCAAASLYRRRDFLAVGGFDEDFFCYAEDVDLGFRLRLAGHRSLYVPDAVVRHSGSALTGRRSDFAIYHGHRNLVWVYVKNMPGIWFWLFLPFQIALTGVTLGKYGRVAWRAKRDALLGLPAMWRKRKGIQRSAMARPVELVRWLRVRIRSSR